MSPRSTREQVVRFALLGGLNTLATGALVALLSLSMDPRLAYTVAYLAGLVANTLVTGSVVFGNAGGTAQRLAYACWYVLVYLVGLLVLSSSGAERGSPYAGMVVFITAPLGFLGARFIFTARHEQQRAGENMVP